MTAVGVAGSTHYDYQSIGANPWLGQVAYIGGNWRYRNTLGPLVPMNQPNVIMTWDAASESWKCSTNANGGPGFACNLAWDVEWKPRAYMAEQVVRAEFDELTPDLLEVWSWRDQAAMLPGHQVYRTHKGGLLWGPDHVRGLTRKLGSQTVPQVAGAYVQFLP